MDRDLVRRAQSGDQWAFTTLASAMYDRLHQIAYRILRDRAAAEDATQQAIVSIWRYLPTLREPERFDAWSYRLLVNACNSEGRKQMRRLPPVGGSRVSEPVSRAGYASIIDRDQLERAFERLSIEHRVVIVLHHYLDWPVERVAKALDIPVGTVNSRLSRALKKLRHALEADVTTPGVEVEVEP